MWMGTYGTVCRIQVTSFKVLFCAVRHANLMPEESDSKPHQKDFLYQQCGCSPSLDCKTIKAVSPTEIQLRTFILQNSLCYCSIHYFLLAEKDAGMILALCCCCFLTNADVSCSCNSSVMRARQGQPNMVTPPSLRQI